jgi:spore germination protein YaaH
MRRPLSVLVLVSALAGALVVPATPSSASPQPDGLEVTGYALPSLPGHVVARDAAGLTQVTTVGTGLTADGRRAVRPSPDTYRVARAARAQGLRTELLISNYSDRLEAFDTRAAARLLRSGQNVRRVARQVAAYATQGPWDGVNLDLEALGPAYAGGLVDLARELQARMPEAHTVSIDVSARGSVPAYRRAGYRLGALARTVDVVQLMAYDEHGPTWSGPGPIGSLDWQRRSVTALLAKVPAAQVDLGVAGYGYTWPRGRVGRSVTVARARALARADGVRPRWDGAAGEWHARLDDGTVVWWSDRRSLALRRALALDAGLHGLAIWRLGSADRLG